MPLCDPIFFLSVSKLTRRLDLVMEMLVLEGYRPSLVCRSTASVVGGVLRASLCRAVEELAVFDAEEDGSGMGGDGKVEIGDGEKSGSLSRVEEARPNPGQWQVAGGR